MAEVSGHIKVFEASDGGSGDPRKTAWQFFVGNQAVITSNENIADTARLAVKTASSVKVSYDPSSHVILQMRMEFTYVCNSEPIRDCDAEPIPPPPPGTKYVCATKRYAPCDPKKPPGTVAKKKR
jgi:hypothetical protein